MPAHRVVLYALFESHFSTLLFRQTFPAHFHYRFKFTDPAMGISRTMPAISAYDIALCIHEIDRLILSPSKDDIITFLF